MLVHIGIVSCYCG